SPSVVASAAPATNLRRDESFMIIISSCVWGRSVPAPVCVEGDQRRICARAFTWRLHRACVRWQRAWFGGNVDHGGDFQGESSRVSRENVVNNNVFRLAMWADS